MFESICSYPLTADLFAQAIHPSEPLVSVGLATGHVETFRLPSDDLSQSQNGGDDADDDDDDDTGSVLSKSSVLSNTTPTGTIERVWRTRRHKGSCRSLAYSVDGALLYSAGTDGLVKVAAADTGRVTAKIVVPFAAASSDGSARVGAAPAVDAPTVIHALSPQSLILATDSGAMYVYDLRDPLIASPSAGAGASSSSSSSPACLSARPQQTHHPHDDYVSSLTPLPPSAASTSGFSKQWITTGGTTVALTDLRRGVLVRSEDQEEELVSSCYVTGLRRGGTSQGEKLLVGGSGGVLTLWEKGAWDDQDERVVVSRERDGAESLEVMAVVPDGVAGAGAAGFGSRGARAAQKFVAVGQSDGHVQLVQLGSNKVVATLRHDELEGVTGLGFDVEGRMVSGGGNVVKVWHALDAGAGGSDSDDGSDDSGDDSDGGVEKRAGRRPPPPSKRPAHKAASDSDDDSSDDDDEMFRSRKKQKGRKGKRRGGGHQVMRFEGLV